MGNEDLKSLSFCFTLDIQILYTPLVYTSWKTLWMMGKLIYLHIKGHVLMPLLRQNIPRWEVCLSMATMIWLSLRSDLHLWSQQEFCHWLQSAQGKTLKTNHWYIPIQMDEYTWHASANEIRHLHAQLPILHVQLHVLHIAPILADLACPF